MPKQKVKASDPDHYFMHNKKHIITEAGLALTLIVAILQCIAGNV